MGSFALGEGETLAGALDAFDTACESYLADVRATGPGADMTAPPAPWDGLLDQTPSVQRFELLRHLEELARHADIAREQIDGGSDCPVACPATRMLARSRSARPAAALRG